MNETSSSPQFNRLAAVILIGLGVLFLFARFTGANIFEISWPFFIIIPGVVFLAAAWFGGKNQAGLFIPGMIIAGTGAILMYQNQTDAWESWAYMWALYPVFVGVGLSLMSGRTGNASEGNAGRGLITGGLIAFVVFATFFEMFIFNDNGENWDVALSLLLIGGGIFLFLGGTRVMSGGKRKHDAPLGMPRSDSAPNVVNMNGARKVMPTGDRLQQEIDAALIDDESPRMV